MRLFISAGEPSGDLHGSNLAKAIHQLEPHAQLLGFGGDKMAAAGVDLLYPLTQLSIMWFSRSIKNLPFFFHLADRAERIFLKQKPDAVVLIDYPGFHWHIAKRAKAAGVPVFYFVPPQLWAWGGWRTRKMRRTVDTVLTALPFEEDWYRKKGVNTQYIGHPYFDELGQQKLDANFLASQNPGSVVAILPGSRNQEVSGNFPMMLATAKKILAARPETRFLVASFNERQANTARQFAEGFGNSLEIHVGRTPEIIQRADVCLAVSGSVGLELMYRLKPSVILYRYSRLARFVSRQLMTCKYISLVNLLADQELFPEFLTYRDASTPMAEKLLSWLNNPAEYAAAVQQLAELKNRVALPGACERAAEFVVSRCRTSQPLRRTA